MISLISIYKNNDIGSVYYKLYIQLGQMHTHTHTDIGIHIHFIYSKKTNTMPNMLHKKKIFLVPLWSTINAYWYSKIVGQKKNRTKSIPKTKAFITKT